MTSFHCINDSKCEWLNGLQAFAVQFNEKFGKDYSLSECLDISGDKNRKQPEVLLEFSGHQPMVIERKRIVYPPDYYQKHRIFHDFWNHFRASYYKKLEPQLQKDIYEICISHDSLCTYAKRGGLAKVSSSIVEHIINQIETLNISDVISSDVPIPWSFYRVIDSDLSNETGLRIFCQINIERSISDLENAKEGIGNQFSKQLSEANEKFQGYEDCLKVLILEICGNIFSMPSFEDILSIINAANISPSIDQIWLGLADPQDESGESIIYSKKCLLRT